jgi:CRP-like cAMP-binding protein
MLLMRRTLRNHSVDGTIRVGVGGEAKPFGCTGASRGSVANTPTRSAIPADLPATVPPAPVPRVPEAVAEQGEPAAQSTLMRLVKAKGVTSTVIQVDRRDTVYGTCHTAQHRHSVYFIERGFVKVVAPSREGKDCLLGIYAAGDLIGDLSLGAAESHESAVAMAPTVLRRVPTVHLRTSLVQEDLRSEFIRYLTQRMVDQQHLIIDLVTANSEHRLGALLIHLAHKIGRRQGEIVVIEARITQEEFSAMVGTTRSRIGLFLRRFVEYGAVLQGKKGRLAVHERRMTQFLTEAAA